MRIWGGISGFGRTIAKVYMGNINGHLYCDILETELKRSIANFRRKPNWFTKKISYYGIRRT